MDQAPVPTPPPLPQPVEVNPQQTSDQRRKRIRALQMGMASTIKTSGQGVAGSGADLVYSGGKQKLGG